MEKVSNCDDGSGGTIRMNIFLWVVIYIYIHI